MLTVKRKVDTEQDRYGGFNVTTEAPAQVGYDIEIDHSYSTAQNVKGETINYSPRQISSNQAQEVSTNNFIQEEVMPGIVKTKKVEEPQTKTNIRQVMETKTKAMLAVYMLVVIALAAIIIATGVAINAKNTKVNTLNSEIAVRNATIIEQNANLEMLDNDNYIKGSAYNNGMVEVENPIEIELLPLEQKTTYQRSSNWFDKFCDFVGNLFGG